jgi:hypothetical protein
MPASQTVDELMSQCAIYPRKSVEIRFAQESTSPEARRAIQLASILRMLGHQVEAPPRERHPRSGRQLSNNVPFIVQIRECLHEGLCHVGRRPRSRLLRQTNPFNSMRTCLISTTRNSFGGGAHFGRSKTEVRFQNMLCVGPVNVSI